MKEEGACVSAAIGRKKGEGVRAARTSTAPIRAQKKIIWRIEEKNINEEE